MITSKLLHWFVRGIGSLATAVCLLIVVSEVHWLYNPPSAEALRQEAVLVGLVVVAVLGAFAAWRWEWFSGVAITISALALGTFVYLTAEQDGPIALIAAIVKGGPFILAGIVFLMGWWGQQYRSKS